jgi:uncharacterized protein with GYD domain
MPTFVVLCKLTDQGVRNIRTLPQVARENDAQAKAAGVEVIGRYYTQGAVDLVMILRATDEQTAAAVLLAGAAQGNFHTETLRAFTLEEMEGIVAKLP